MGVLGRLSVTSFAPDIRKERVNCLNSPALKQAHKRLLRTYKPFEHRRESIPYTFTQNNVRDAKAFAAHLQVLDDLADCANQHHGRCKPFIDAGIINRLSEILKGLLCT